MNIILQELKLSVRSFLSYTVGMLVIFLLFLLLFDSFRGEAALLDQVLSNFPKEFKAAFGFADVNLSELSGYLSFLFSYIILIGAVFGMKLGVSSLSEETRAKTADFLLSKPVKRHQIVTAKLLSILLLLAAQNLLVYVITLPVALSKADGNLSVKLFSLICFSVFLVQLFFVGIGMFLSVLLKKIKAVMPITLAVVFLFFIIELINQSLMEQKLTYLTPFSYFKSSQVISNVRYEPGYVVIDLSVFIVFTLLTYLLYQKKDIHSA